MHDHDHGTCHCLVRCAAGGEAVSARNRVARYTRIGDRHGALIAALSLVGRHADDPEGSAAWLRERFPGLLPE